jgi:GT2 family glycosyltransferase
MVYIVLVNWNGWKDTIECLESLFRLRDDEYRVIVCDNGSTDGSVELIKAWADGRLDTYVPAPNRLRSLTFPPISKPVRICEMDAPATYYTDNEAPLVLIRSGRNLGFAGGNNLGLRYALSSPDMRLVWLLNNDTVVDPKALTALLKRLSEVPGAGICGSTVRYYHRPDRAQLLGGVALNIWRGHALPIGEGTREDTAPDQDAVEREMDYVYGASMLVTRSFLEEVGLLNEAYFLYYEEIDWARRSANSFKMVYARDCIVYHRGGGSTDGGAGAFSVYHFTRSWLIFTRRYHFARMPVIVLLLLRRIVRAFVTGHQEIGRAIARGVRDGCWAATTMPTSGNARD